MSPLGHADHKLWQACDVYGRAVYRFFDTEVIVDPALPPNMIKLVNLDGSEAWYYLEPDKDV